MILANVIFGTRRGMETYPLEEAAESYLVALARSGQLCGPYFLTWTKGRLNAHVLLAAPTSFQLRHHTLSGKKELEKLITAFGKSPVWKVLDDEAQKRTSTWKGAPFLYLFAHVWASPVCRGDGKKPIPVFRFPLTTQHKSDLYCWQRDYNDHHQIWIGSGKLEIPAYRQLVDPESDLAADGRELCREIEATTGVPTYYYLMRYWGRSKGEDRRPCPGCGEEWGARRITEPREEFWHFDFKCDACRLVSHLGVSTDGGRHTRIGEFARKRKSI